MDTSWSGSIRKYGLQYYSNEVFDNEGTSLICVKFLSIFLGINIFL